MNYFEKKTATTEFTENHDSFHLPLVTICFDPFFKNLESTEFSGFDTKNWAYSWTDGFKKDFNTTKMLKLWEQSNYVFEDVLEDILVFKKVGNHMVEHSFNRTDPHLAKLFNVSTICTICNGRCNTIKWKEPVRASEIIVFIFKVPKSSLYNITGMRNYEDKIKVYVHDITAKVRTKSLFSSKMTLSCN